MLPALNEQDLSPYFNRAALIKEAASQLKKDLIAAGIKIDFSENAPADYHEFFVQIEPLIRKFIVSGCEKLIRLLYCIDVDEKRIAEAVETGENISKRITELILWRELQKVVIRNHFKK